MAISFKGAHFPPEVRRRGGRWQVAYPLSTRHVEERMKEREVDVDHCPINRWTIQQSPLREEALHRRKRPVWGSWRLDETSSKGKGQWRSLSRAVDKPGQTMDFLRTAQRETAAALRLLKKASHRHGVPATIPMDGRDAKEAASKRSNAAPGTPIAIGQVPYLHHIVEQDHRGGKRITRPLVGFKAFDAAPATLVGSALMHLITKRQLVVEEGQEGRTTAEWFDSRAA